MRTVPVNDDAVRDAVKRVAGRFFHTKDLSEDDATMRAQQPSRCHRLFHRAIGEHLRDNQQALGIRCVQRGGPRGALWERIDHTAPAQSDASGLAAATRAPGRPESAVGGSTREPRVIRPGHYRSLEYMSSPAFRSVKDLFESVPEFGGVYFRPVDRGLTVVDLSATSRKPLIGIGKPPYIPHGATAEQLRPTMAGRVTYLEQARRTLAKSCEKQFEARLIRAAQADQLRLPGFATSLRFIHSQWRSDPSEGRSARLPDLIAIDLTTQGLALIELKAEASHLAAEQVAEYRAYFSAYGSELRPFFARLAQVMGALYGCPELEGIGSVSDVLSAFVAWPGPDGAPQVHEC